MESSVRKRSGVFSLEMSRKNKGGCDLFVLSTNMQQLLVFVFIAFSLVHSDPCYFPYQGLFANHSLVCNIRSLLTTKVSDCIFSIPFSESIRSDTLTSLRRAYPLNVFGDIIKNSGAPYYINVDVLSELNVVETATYPNDFSFHEVITMTVVTCQALGSIYGRSHDGHMWYKKPACYSLLILQPFDLYSFAVQGK